MTTKIHNVRGYAWIIILLSSSLLFDKYVMQVFPSLITDDMMGSFRTVSDIEGVVSTQACTVRLRTPRGRSWATAGTTGTTVRARFRVEA